MGARVYLHIGLQKSGTTYLQHALHERSDALLANGVLYPNAGRRVQVPNHQLAFYGLLPEAFPWVGSSVAARGAASWQRLRRTVERSRNGDRSVLLSAEVLSYLGPADVHRVVAELAGFPGGVHAIVTARSLDRLVTSAWQQNVRSGDGTGLETFLRARAANRDELYARGDRDPGFLPWRAFGLGALVSRWSAELGPQAVTVVVNRGKPPELLWQRFLDALDLPPGHAVAPVDMPQDRANVGLRWAQTEVLAQVNRDLAEAGVDAGRAAEVREAVVSGGFLAGPDVGPGLGLPADWRAKVEDWSADELATLERLGTRLVGSAAELVPRSAPEESGSLPTAQDFRDAAQRALVALAASEHFAVPTGRHGTRLRGALASVKAMAGAGRAG